jgi:hypothetical protein
MPDTAPYKEWLGVVGSIVVAAQWRHPVLGRSELNGRRSVGDRPARTSAMIVSPHCHRRRALASCWGGMVGDVVPRGRRLPERSAAARALRNTTPSGRNWTPGQARQSKIARAVMRKKPAQ